MIEKTEIKKAYMALKSHYYHDNSSTIYIKHQIAKFEAENFGGMEGKFECIAKGINENNYIGQLIKKISFKRIIKSLKEEEKKEEDGLITHFFMDSNQINHTVNINYIIDAPIELHIIAVLWTQIVGKKLDYTLSTNSYGNRLNSIKEETIYSNGIKKIIKLKNNKKIFKLYYVQYQKWRNRALTKAKQMLEEDKNDIAIISMDIKQFYYNIPTEILNLNFINNENETKEFNENINNKKEKVLNNIIKEINEKYSDSLNKERNKKENSLPIGLLSSPIIANYALKEVDKYIEENLKMDYYGRYVDDFIFVFKINKPLLEKTTKKILEDLFHIKPKELKEVKESEEVEEFDKDRFIFGNSLKYNNFEFSSEKLKVYLFKSDETHAIIDIFNKKIKDNISVFNFLPEDEEELLETFNNSALDIQCNGTINNFSAIDALKEDKLQLSIFLSKIISANNHSASTKNDRFIKEIKLFFKGKYLIKYSLLWEKLFTYFLSREKYKELIEIYIEIYKEIEKINKINGDKVINDQEKIKVLKVDLKEHLDIIFSLSCALNINSFDKFTLYNKKIIKDKLSDLKKISKNYLTSNMLRQRYINIPLGNYLEKSDSIKIEDEKINFFKADYFNFFKDKKLSEEKLYFSPRFIHYDEFVLVDFIINRIKDEKIKIENNSYKNFKKYSIKGKNFKVLEKYNNLKKYENENQYKIEINCIDDKNRKEKIKIGLGILEVKDNDMTNNLDGKPNISFERNQKINKILNRARKEKVDILIFPELILPFVWIKKIIEFSRKNDIAIIVGIEHLKVENSNKEKVIYNYIATILPFYEEGKFKNTEVKFRVKNHYSPMEKMEIEGRGFKIPCQEKHHEYNLFVWKGVFFTVFNCFELTDIRARSEFIGLIDFLIVSECNRDIEYFDDIAKSTSRDLNCYVVQSNSANYGGIGITQPKSSYEKTLLNFKGEENINLIVGTLDIKGLRKHQKTTHEDQILKKRFKPTPPNYKIKYTYNREKIDFESMKNNK